MPASTEFGQHTRTHGPHACAVHPRYESRTHKRGEIVVLGLTVLSFRAREGRSVVVPSRFLWVALLAFSVVPSTSSGAAAQVETRGDFAVGVFPVSATVGDFNHD